MIRPDVRINAIFDNRNFDDAFCYCFGAKGFKELTIAASQLRNNAFRSFSTLKSESECEMMIQEPFKLSNLVTELKMASDGCIVSTFDGLKINPAKYLQWKKLVFLNGQDLFVAALFGNDVRLDWPNSLPMNSDILDAALKDGFAENHCHFSAAGPSFSVNWLLLHNGSPIMEPLRLLETREWSFFRKYYREEDYNRFRNVAALSIYLRRCLFHKCRFGKSTLEMTLKMRPILFADLSKPQPALMNMFIDKATKIPVHAKGRGVRGLYDYACPTNYKNPLCGERRLLVDVLKRYSGWSNREKAYFYLYLLCKRYISSFFVQNNSYYGFFNFKRFEQTTELLIPKDASSLAYEINALTYDAIMHTPNLNRAEIRTAPKSTVPELKTRLLSMSPPKSGRIRFGLVLHFIKETEALEEKGVRSGAKLARPRSFELMEKYEKQANVIKEVVLSQNRHGSLPIIGVDAANEEIRCRPEIFAPFYRDLRKSRPLHKDGQRKSLGLHFTFHAGEDFVSLTDGLRAIDEAVEFLELSNGDRIGHASALGTDVNRYHELKGDRVLQNKQDYLDDCSFLYRSIIGLSGFDAERAKLESEIDKFLIEIYGFAHIPSYLRSIALRVDHPLVHKKLRVAGSFFATEREWFSGGKRYFLKRPFEGDYKAAWSDEAALRYVHLYHYDLEVRAKGRKLVEIQLTPNDKDAIDMAQRILLAKIIEKNIGIETNPTSNYLIGPYEDFDDVPTLIMLGLDHGKEHYRGLRISLGSDDPGLFGISLHNEYGSVLYSLQRKGNLRGIDLIEEIRRIAKSSMDLSFI